LKFVKRFGSHSQKQYNKGLFGNTTEKNGSEFVRSMRIKKPLSWPQIAFLHIGQSDFIKKSFNSQKSAIWSSIDTPYW